MPTSKQLALNAASAAVAGVVTIVRPARFPRWARRGLSVANTAGTASSLFFAIRGDEEPPAGHPLHKALATSDVVAAATGGLMLITSGLGLKADARVERFLVERGVRHPRLVMAAGVVTVMFVVKTVQDSMSKSVSKSRSDKKPAAAPLIQKPPVTTKPANPILPTGSPAAPPEPQE